MSERIRETIQNRFNSKLIRLEQIKSGNNRVLKACCENHRYFLVKVYPLTEDDQRDRLGVEFQALTFLRKNGMVAVPRPLHAERKEGFAVYEFIEGTPIRQNGVGREDIEIVTDFLKELSELSLLPNSASLPAASEACGSYSSYANSLERRLKRLQAISSETSLHEEAQLFLETEFIPVFEDTRAHYYEALSAVSLDPSEGFRRDQMTLSPSDFGFHNAIKKAAGGIAFVDFEYFGWDDPAKMIGDFLHHAAFSLSEDLKQLFMKNMLSVFGRDGSLPDRVRLVHPLIGLKWCMILLNEFLPGPLERRKAGNGSLTIEDALNGQLMKARRKLSEVVEQRNLTYEVA